MSVVMKGPARSKYADDPPAEFVLADAKHYSTRGASYLMATARENVDALVRAASAARSAPGVLQLRSLYAGNGNGQRRLQGFAPKLRHRPYALQGSLQQHDRNADHDSPNRPRKET